MARISSWLAISCLSLCSVSCSTATPRPPLPADPAQALARSLAIINSATPAHPRVLKILFYGQSISTPKWTDQAMAALRGKYPNVAFDVRNLALGGWAAPILERAVNRDIDEFYPDLIVFHVYGDKNAYERIIRAFRTRTAADIIVQTDHVVDPVEPLCDEGFHLRWSPPPGCTGHIRFKQRVWEEYMSGIWIPTLSRKYDLAVEPRRQRWNAYLKAHRMQPAALLADPPHPNASGWTVMANLFSSWFEALVEQQRFATPTPHGSAQIFAPPEVGTGKTYRFEGNRIELVAQGPLNGKVQVKIDGKAPQNTDGCWQNSRVSRLPNLPDWPGLKQVAVTPSYHEADRWTLRLTGFNSAQDRFNFTLTSAKKGPDGKGSADNPFTSPTGIVSIQPDDWILAYAKSVARKGAPEGVTLQWERRFVCTDQPAIALGNGKVEQRHVLATGLVNGRHVVELKFSNDAPAISEIRTYRPSAPTLNWH